MKIVPNPSYQHAAYEFRFLPKGCKQPDYPVRFNTKPPQKVYRSRKSLNDWIKTNYIPAFVLKKD